MGTLFVPIEPIIVSPGFRYLRQTTLATQPSFGVTYNDGSQAEIQKIRVNYEQR